MRRLTSGVLIALLSFAPSAVAGAQDTRDADAGVPADAETAHADTTQAHTAHAETTHAAEPPAETTHTAAPSAETAHDATQPTPPTRRGSSSGNAFPLVSYSRETGFAFGGFGVVYFRIGDSPPESNPSYVAADAIVTTREQVLGDILPEFWWDHERWLINGEIAYRRFPDYFYGIGNDTRPRDEEPYLLHTIWTRFDLRYRVWKSLFIGARHEFQWHELLQLDKAPMLSSGNVRGSDGGVRHGLGPMLVWDSRDNTLSARSGLYYQASFRVFGGFLGSDYDYARLTLDARHYLALGERHTLAFQVYLDMMAGDVPFTELARLGGVSRMRGYYEGQYRDKTYAMAQLEYRVMPLFWRIGAVLFAGLGEVGERWRDFSVRGLKWAVGVGLRFALNVEERIHLRLDAGVGPGTWGAYVNVLEAF